MGDRNAATKDNAKCRTLPITPVTSRKHPRSNPGTPQRPDKPPKTSKKRTPTSDGSTANTFSHGGGRPRSGRPKRVRPPTPQCRPLHRTKMTRGTQVDPSMIADSNIKVSGGKARELPKRSHINKAVEVAEMVRGKPGRLLTLERATMIVKSLVSFMVGVEFIKHPERGSQAFTYVRYPMNKMDCITETVAMLGHRVATVRAAYEAITSGPRAVTEWYHSIVTNSCKRNGSHLIKLPRDMLITLDRVLQNDVITKGKELNWVVVVDEVAKCGMRISERTAQRVLVKLGYGYGLLTSTYLITSKRLKTIETMLWQKQKYRRLEDEGCTYINITVDESFLHQGHKKNCKEELFIDYVCVLIMLTLLVVLINTNAVTLIRKMAGWQSLILWRWSIIPGSTCQITQM